MTIDIIGVIVAAGSSLALVIKSIQSSRCVRIKVFGGCIDCTRVVDDHHIETTEINNIDSETEPINGK